MNKTLVAAALAALVFTNYVSAAQWADLQMTFVLKGTAPRPKPVIDIQRDPFCAALPITSETMIVNSKNNGIQHVGLYVDTKRYELTEIHPDLKAVPQAKIVLNNINCVFKPRVLVVRPGQTITVTNSDKTGHNANFVFFENAPLNFTIPIGGSKDIFIEHAEAAICPVECGSHPWMKAHIIAQDHPYAGVSDADGVLKIDKLPAGKVAFRIWHENTATSIDEVVINGKKETWAKARLDLELKAGMNKFHVEIDAKKFK